MRTNPHISINLSKYKEDIGADKSRYPSKLIADLMNSDSSENDDDPYDYNNLLNNQQHSQQQEQNNKNRGYQTSHISNNRFPPRYNSFNNKKQSPPPLANFRQQQKYKQNVFMEANKSRQSIRYNCFKIQGNKIIQHSSNNQYNTLNIQQASMIPHNNQEDQSISNNSIQQPYPPLFSNNAAKQQQNAKYVRQQFKMQKQIDPLHPTRGNKNITIITNSHKNQYLSSSTSTSNSQSLIQLQKKLKISQRQLSLLHQQMQTKDKYYQQLTDKYQQTYKQNKQNIQIMSQMKTQNKYLKQQICKLEVLLKQNKSNNEEVLNKKKKQMKKQQDYMNDVSNKIYQQISQYILKIVEEFKNKLIKCKMSVIVEDIIQEFMTELVNINKISVSRSKNRNVLAFQTNSSITTNKQNKQIKYNHHEIKESKFITASTLATYNRNFSQLARTPQKPNKCTQKSEQLRNLQKSLHKLREMEKQHTPTRSQIKNDNSAVSKYTTTGNIQFATNQRYDSLDRSSLMMMDRSANRSKSQRKKIFG